MKRHLLLSAQCLKQGCCRDGSRRWAAGSGHRGRPPKEAAGNSDICLKLTASTLRGGRFWLPLPDMKFWRRIWFSLESIYESMLGCWILVWRGCISKYQIVPTILYGDPRTSPTKWGSKNLPHKDIICLCGGGSWIPISICLCSCIPMAEKNRTPGNREKLATTSRPARRCSGEFSPIFV